MPLIILAVRALICTRLCSAIGPQVLWSKTLPNGGFIGEGLRKGTGVVLSSNEETLWATSENGGVFVLGVADGRTLASFEPETIAGRNTESRSSVSLYQTSESVEFGVYAVVDVLEHHGDDDAMTMMTSDTRYVCTCFFLRLAVVSPVCELIIRRVVLFACSRFPYCSSRIIALTGDATDGELGTLRWSTAVSGVVEGTPLIGSDGTWIYITHNNNVHAIITILDSSDGSVVWQSIDPRPMAKYGPVSRVQKNEVDKVYWADAHDRGYADGGRIHVIVSDFLEAGVHSQRSFASSSTVAPILSKDGKNMWIGGRGATIHGWDDTNLHPVWSAQLTQSPRNESYRK